MKEKLINIKNTALSLISQARDANSLEEIRIQFLGKNGQLTRVTKNIGGLSPEERKKAGLLANEIKNIIEDTLRQNQEKIAHIPPQEKKTDVSAPGIKPAIGHIHVFTQMLLEVVDVFKSLGYQATDGPEIETDYYNFEALNIPAYHPARDTQQTFYLDNQKTNIGLGEIILRTQTSAMQPRVMEKIKPPVRVIAPGKNFRYEQVDASHGFEFWQTEGFMVDKNVRLTDLFGTIDYVLKKLMGSNVKIKFATTNFPFVEPGVDTYMECTICKGRGCGFCKGSGWSEIMPAGMIHPNVFKAAGYNPSEVTGFAFAIGLSRLVSLRYQISDLRTLVNPDLRILEQF